MKKAVYNVITGGYDELHDPKIITPGWDYICFTDNNNLRSEIWDIRVIEKDPNLCDAKNAKKITALFHKYLPDYDLTLYTVGYAVISCDLDFLLSDRKIYHEECDINFLHHKRHDNRKIKSYGRYSVYTEAELLMQRTELEQRKDQSYSLSTFT